MENFKFVDLNTFERIDYYNYFKSMGTTIEFTVKIDITKLLTFCKENNLSFQAMMLFKLYKSINSVENFKYDILENKLIKWEKIVPTFSSINKKTNLFSTLYAHMSENYKEYDRHYKETTKQFQNSTTILPQGALPKNIFNVSCIPALHFEHFSSNSKSMENQIIKMITYGKYEKANNCFTLPLTIQISHAIADGYHVSCFFEHLKDELSLIK